MAEMVADSPDKYLEKLNFRSEICISCDWRRIDLLASTKVRRPSVCLTCNLDAHAWGWRLMLLFKGKQKNHLLIGHCSCMP